MAWIRADQICRLSYTSSQKKKWKKNLGLAFWTCLVQYAYQMSQSFILNWMVEYKIATWFKWLVNLLGNFFDVGFLLVHIFNRFHSRRTLFHLASELKLDLLWILSYARAFHANRWTLESLGTLEPRRSALEDDFEEEEEKEEDDQLMDELDVGAHEKVYIFFPWKNHSPCIQIQSCFCCFEFGVCFLVWYVFLFYVYRIIIVGEALQGREIGIESVTVTDIGKTLSMFLLFGFLFIVCPFCLSWGTVSSHHYRIWLDELKWKLVQLQVCTHTQKFTQISTIMLSPWHQSHW